MSAALVTLEQLLSLSEAMLLSANSDDWTTLAKQQREREALTARPEPARATKTDLGSRAKRLTVRGVFRN
jgi:hypothetical protein